MRMRLLIVTCAIGAACYCAPALAELGSASPGKDSQGSQSQGSEVWGGGGTDSSDGSFGTDTMGGTRSHSGGYSNMTGTGGSRTFRNMTGGMPGAAPGYGNYTTMPRRDNRLHSSSYDSYPPPDETYTNTGGEETGAIPGSASAVCKAPSF